MVVSVVPVTSPFPVSVVPRFRVMISVVVPSLFIVVEVSLALTVEIFHVGIFVVVIFVIIIVFVVVVVVILLLVLFQVHLLWNISSVVRLGGVLVLAILILH